MADGVADYISAEEVRLRFIRHLSEYSLSELSMDEFWTVLRHQGARVRGATIKDQRKYVYTALWGDKRFELVSPGVFALRAASET